MLSLRSLLVENIGPIKSIALPLDLPGVTVIRGSNLDSIKGDSNGVGKTALFSSIPNLFYFEPPNAVKKKSAKTFLGSEGKIKLTFESFDRHYEVIQRARGTSVKYEISKDSDPLKIHRTRDVQDDIRNIFPLTIEQYYSTVYLNATSNNRLLMGRGTERMDLFENLFLLEIYERMQEEIKEKYEQTKQAAASKKVISQELEALGEKVDLNPLHIKLKKLQKSMDVNRSLNEELLREQTKLETATRIIKDTDLSGIETVEEDLRKSLKDLNALSEEQLKATRIQEKWEAYFRYKKKSASLKERLSEITPCDKIDTSNIIDRIDELQKALSEYNSINVNDDKLKEIKTLLKEYDSFKEMKQERDRLSAEISTVSRHLKLHRSGRSSCPECGSEIKYFVKDVDSLKKKEVSYSKKIERIERVLDSERDYNALLSMGDFREDRCRSKLDKLNIKLREAKESNRNYDERKEISQRLEDLKVEKPSKEAPNVQKITKDIKLLERSVEDLRRLNMVRKALNDLEMSSRDLSKVEIRLKGVKEKRQEIGAKMSSLSDSISNIELQISSHRSKESLRQSLEARLEKIDALSRKLSVFTVLADAYGPKGLKIFAIQSLVERYIENMNNVSTEFFRVPFKFSLEMKGRDMSILAERNGGTVTDVRQLSGFEGRSFAIASVVSLLPLLARSHQTNILILDEMETCLSVPNRKILAHDLIPKVTQFIPSVYVVTATSPEEFYVPDSRELTIVKKNNISTLKGL